MNLATLSFEDIAVFKTVVSVCLLRGCYLPICAVFLFFGGTKNVVPFFLFYFEELIYLLDSRSVGSF